MSHEAHATHAHAAKDGSTALPAFFSILLTAIWGAYTLTVVYEILSMPLPAYPG